MLSKGRKGRGFQNAHKSWGSRGNSTSYGNSKHVTAVVAVSASGLIEPPIFIVAGKTISSTWIDPIQGSFRNVTSGICSRCTKPNWFPCNGVIKVTENGSMEMPILTAVINHIDNSAREHSHKALYLLLLDGKSSRKGIQRIE